MPSSPPPLLPSPNIVNLATHETCNPLETSDVDSIRRYKNSQTLSPLCSASTVSDLTLVGDSRSSPFSTAVEVITPRPRKKRRDSGQHSFPRSGAHTSTKHNRQMTTNAAEDSSMAVQGPAVAAANKPKRVRTGCLTCRERHLKCDEGLPICQNCRKSNRSCKRGVRLNFIDTQVQSPPMIPPTTDWLVQFQDESREIASEYKGGLSLYANLNQIITPPAEPVLDYHPPPRGMAAINTHMAQQIALPPIVQPAQRLYPEDGMTKQENSIRNSRHHSHTNSESSYLPTAPPTAYSNSDTHTSSKESRECLNNPDEVEFMQVFVEEVGLWMDSMDAQKHFSRILPFASLGEPMLLNAFLACGARHLTMINPAKYKEDKALYYYDTATTQLLRALQNPDRDTVVCATAAVILNVYEIMSERALQRMNHIAGARALIKECGWNANSGGVGSACFWLNVGMEVLSCLHFNWQVAWDPEQWGLDMDMHQQAESGNEELWVHRILFIAAKIANFRASIPRFQEPSAHDEQLRLQKRLGEWDALKSLCDAWNSLIPRTMQPMGFLQPHHTSSKSNFPEVWLIKRATIVGRLFYHTAMTLLAQTHPLMPKDTPEMIQTQLTHAHQICGIAAHCKDRGVSSVAIRSMAIAAEVLVERREQEEALRILDRIRTQTGWKISFLHDELREKWGWPNEAQAQQHMMAQQNSLSQFFPSTTPGSTVVMAPATQLPPPPAPPQMRGGVPGGIPNPLLRTADFSLPNHPYQQYYQPPNQSGNSFTHSYF